MKSTRHFRVMEDILEANDVVARRLQRRWNEAGTLVLDLLSASGAGKTTLLEAALPKLANEATVAVMEGDVETERDAERLRAIGIDAFQIITAGICHLEAHMVESAWKLFDLPTPPDYLFIENVGNLVCPASFQLGQHLRIVLLSVPEGDDKPAKYPKAFRQADACVITKIDLLPYFNFSIERALDEAKELQPKLATFAVSAKTGEGVQEWLSYLKTQRQLRFDAVNA